MDNMDVIFRSPVNLFKTVLSILHVLMDGLVLFIMCQIAKFAVRGEDLPRALLYLSAQNI